MFACMCIIQTILSIILACLHFDPGKKGSVLLAPFWLNPHEPKHPLKSQCLTLARVQSWVFSLLSLSICSPSSHCPILSWCVMSFQFKVSPFSIIWVTLSPRTAEIMLTSSSSLFIPSVFPFKSFTLYFSLSHYISFLIVEMTCLL